MREKILCKHQNFEQQGKHGRCICSFQQIQKNLFFLQVIFADIISILDMFIIGLIISGCIIIE